MLDVQPTASHRVLVQSYPGGIQSGADWYQPTNPAKSHRETIVRLQLSWRR
jgi:hypothetical protein